MGGYVGNARDKQRLALLEKDREEKKRKFEDARLASQSGGAALRQFGAATSEAVENAFKNETVGLVTRAQFVEKRALISERLSQAQSRCERRDAGDEQRVRGPGHCACSSNPGQALQPWHDTAVTACSRAHQPAMACKPFHMHVSVWVHPRRGQGHSASGSFTDRAAVSTGTG